MKSDLDKIRARFIEMIGQNHQEKGFPKISGRILALLVFDGKPISFGDLATQLQISRGSVSTNIRLLESHNMVERIAITGDRQDYFQLTHSPFQGSIRSIAKQLASSSDQIRKLCKDITSPEITERLEGMAKFQDDLAKILTIN